LANPGDPGDGGSGVATATANGIANVVSTATAAGGDGGGAINQNATPGGSGGAATATSTADSAGSATAQAVATGGVGAPNALFGVPIVGASGAAEANAIATGSSGSFSASAATSATQGQIILSISARAEGVVDGSSNGEADAALATSSDAFVTGPQAVALAVGTPSSASTSAVLAANANIAAAFGESPVFFATAELGGSYSTGGKTTQTATGEMDEVVDLTQLSSRQDLVVGLYNGDAVGAGVTSVTFDVYANGADLLHQTFATAGAAQAYFTDNAVDLGSLTVLGGEILTLRAVLSVTSTSAGSGFYGDLIVGDPPSAQNSTTHHKFVAAMAGFGAVGAGAVQTALETWRADRVMMVAPRAMIA
jgi:hypothetical protein